MNEAIINFTHWKETIASDRWIAFSLEILDLMRTQLKIFQEETGNLYNLEATPAEWTTYRFAKEDQKQFPKIQQAWSQSAPYYTNSTQLPVEYTQDCFEALDLQNELQTQYTWWTVLHIYLWEKVSNGKWCKQLVKKILTNYQLPYITITPTFSLCPKHWYIVGEHDYCPKCDAEIGYIWTTKDKEKRVEYIKTY